MNRNKQSTQGTGISVRHAFDERLLSVIFAALCFGFTEFVVLCLSFGLEGAQELIASGFLGAVTVIGGLIGYPIAQSGSKFSFQSTVLRGAAIPFLSAYMLTHALPSAAGLVTIFAGVFAALALRTIGVGEALQELAGEGADSGSRTSE